MYAYKKAKAPEKTVQRIIANAQAHRAQANAIAAAPPIATVPLAGTVYAVSTGRYAVTPQHFGAPVLPAIGGGKIYAPTVPGGNQAGNHAERKLIFHDPALTELGVNTQMCTGCRNQIVANAATINHVSDPTGTYQVNPFGLTWVAP